MTYSYTYCMSLPTFHQNITAERFYFRFMAINRLVCTFFPSVTVVPFVHFFSRITVLDSILNDLT